MPDASKGPVPSQDQSKAAFDTARYGDSGLPLSYRAGWRAETPAPTETYPWEPPYGMTRGHSLDEHNPRHSHAHRVELAAALEDVRRRVCGYSRMKHGSAASDYRTADDARCDCKYGLGYRYLGDVSNYNTEMTGCPELRELIWHLLHGDVVELVKLREQNAALSDDNASLTEQVARLKSDNERLRTENRDVLYASGLKTENNTRLHQQLEQARGELLKAKGEVESWQSLYAASQEQRDGWRENAEAAENEHNTIVAERDFAIEMLDMDGAEFTEAFCSGITAREARRRRQGQVPNGQPIEPAVVDKGVTCTVCERWDGNHEMFCPVPKLTPPEQMPAKIEELRGRLFGANGDDLGTPLAEAMAEIEADEAEMSTKVFEALGAASVAWSETPKGVFDSAKAKQVGDDLLEFIRTRPESHAQPSEGAGGGQNTSETPWASQRPNGGPREVVMDAETVLNVRLPWGGLVHVTVGRNAEDATVETYTEHDGHGYPDTVVRVRRPA